jgi:hypothetical protein
VKFSAKLLTALAAIALLVVVALGSSGTVKATHGGTTHADGKVYLTNKWSALTTNANGFTSTEVGQKETYVGSGKTLYGTFIEKNSGGTAQQAIETNSNIVVVSIVDADQNLPVTKTATSSFGGTEGTTYNLGALAGAASVPIIDSDSDGLYTDEIAVVGATDTSPSAWAVTVTNVAQGIFQVFSADGSSVSQALTFTWKTSAVDTITGLVTVTSTSDIVGIKVDATETGTNTGIFRSEVTLIDAEVTGAVSATTSATAGNLKILNNGTITAQYEDKTPAGTTALQTTGTKISATGIAETTIPQIVISEPIHNAATQDRSPTFKGSVSDAAAGVKAKDGVLLFIDKQAEAKNTNVTPVDVTVGGADQNKPDVGTAVDGAASVAWNHTPTADLPASTTGDVDHIIDFQVRANDLAGNINWSDNDGDAGDNVATPEIGTATPGERSPAGRGAPHLVRVDRTLPSISSVSTGHYWDSTTNAVKTDRATSLEVEFDGPIDSSTIDNTDFEVKISTVAHVPSAAEVFSKKPQSVFLTLDTSIPTDNKPVISVKNTLADTAGNTTNAGSKAAVDKLAPVLTVALSGGAASDPDGLTKSDIVATVTSTESLTTVTVAVYTAASATSSEASVIPVFQGSNVWKATLKGSSLAATTQGGDKKSVYVSGSDTAGNAGTIGKQDIAATTGVVSYKLDKVKPTLSVTPSTTTRDPRPFVQLNFGEKVTVAAATFNKVDVLSSLASTDTQKYVYKPTADLTVGTQTVKATVTDLAGNEIKDLSATFSAKAKTKFSLALLPGWNFVSLPANPTDPSINAVVTNADVTTVVAYDSTAGVFTSAVRDGTTLGGALTTMDASTAYWVETTSSDPVKVELVKPQGAQLPPSVDVVIGWNAIPVIDTSGDAAVGDKAAGASLGKTFAAYFIGTKIQRAYEFDTLSDKFVEIAAVATNTADPVLGKAYWGFFTAAGTVLP